ncbi:Ankyrin repeat [Vermiconidia calcicola]|uniref:Ankyrin repeat n=1 Tax=Vermiconidia calcicola TaxID=1690605 RepID=A0ACC3NGS0_9PEZI|nr:Ankyrin repeat [Vermiconidia calcicola]
MNDCIWATVYRNAQVCRRTVYRERYLNYFNAAAEIGPQICGNLRPDQAIRWQPPQCTEPERAMPARLSQEIVSSRRVEQPLRLVNTDAASMACKSVPEEQLLKIYHATGDNDSASLKTLLKRGLQPTLLPKDTDTLFHSAFPGKRSMLTHACERNAKSSVEYLIQFGSDVNVRDAHGWTALHITCLRGHADITKLLLDSNAQFGRLNHEGHTPLDLAVWERQASCARLLLDAGATLNQTLVHEGELLLQEVCRPYSIHYSTDSMVRVLLDCGVDPNHGGGRILANALTYASAETVQMLLSAGADVEFVSTTWEVQLETARFGALGSNLYGEMVEKMQLLVEHHTRSAGCNRHAIVRAFQIRAGIKAIRDGDVLRLDQLMRSNHPVDAVARYQATLREMAAAYTQRYFTCLLHDLASRQNLQMAESLLQRGLDPNEQDGKGETALINSCFEGDDEMTALLMRHGADSRIAGKSGYTPSWVATRMDNAQVVSMLLAAGACVHGSGARDVCSPLQVACGYSSLRSSSVRASDNLMIVRALVAGGADVNTGPGPSPPLGSALAWAPADVVEILFDAGATVDNVPEWPKVALKRQEGVFAPLQSGHYIMDAKEKVRLLDQYAPMWR